MLQYDDPTIGADELVGEEFTMPALRNRFGVTTVDWVGTQRLVKFPNGSIAILEPTEDWEHLPSHRDRIPFYRVMPCSKDQFDIFVAFAQEMRAKPRFSRSPSAAENLANKWGSETLDKLRRFSQRSSALSSAPSAPTEHQS